MKVKFVRQYRSKREETKGQKRFSYQVLGTAEELAQFQKQQKEFFLETEDGKVLWNRTEDYGKSPEVVVTQEGNFTMVLDEYQVASEKAQKHPMFAQMYFAQAEARENASVRTGVSAPKTVASIASDLDA